MSCVEAVPIVVSVPKTIKCLSLSEIIDITEVVGAPDITVALVSKAAVVTERGSHSNILPFLIVHTNFCPKWSSDHVAGSSSVVEDKAACPHAV